jgi:hypothetical protein
MNPAAAARASLLTLAVLVVARPALPQAGGSIRFTDVTETAGVALPGLTTESVAWGDYDNDGDEDLYLTNDGPNRLFRNDGGGRFADVTVGAGVGSPAWSVGAAFGDLDNDGDLDLYVVNFQRGLDLLYRNDGPAGPGGAHVFTDVALQANTVIERSSRGMALLDFDRDGLLDIYVMGIGGNVLYWNRGNLTFVDLAAQAGVQAPATGVGVVASDLDGDGWLDIFTGNRSFDPNRLFLKDAVGFRDVTLEAGILAVGLGMGVISFDYDNDLDFDLYWTAWPGDGLRPGDGAPVPNAFYRNLRGIAFDEVAAETGTLDALGWGISAGHGDVDLDGWMDFVVTNGFSPDTTPNVLFRNRGDGTFENATTSLGGGRFDGRGVGFADYDGDGDLDVIVTAGATAPTRLWRNDSVTGHHWLTLRLLGTVSNRSAIGARVEVQTPLRTTVQEVSGGAGRGNQSSLPLEFGLGTADRVLRITVRWPSGLVQAIEDVAVDQALTITEGS